MHDLPENRSFGFPVPFLAEGSGNALLTHTLLTETLKGEKLDVSDWTAEVPNGDEDEITESGEESEEDDSD